MLSRVVSKVLNQVLGKFIENLDNDQLQMSLVHGRVTLEHLRLKSSVLDAANLPVNLVVGYVGRIFVDIPWTELASKPLQISVEDICVLLRPKPLAQWNEEQIVETIKQLKKDQLDAIELLSSGKHKGSDGGFVGRLVAKIVDNIQITIRNVHIKYENDFGAIDDASNANFAVPQFSFGIVLGSLSLHTTNERGKGAAVSDSHFCFKACDIEGLAIYLDCNAQANYCSKYLDNDNNITSYFTELCSTEHVAALHAEDHALAHHNYVLAPVSCELRLRLNKHMWEKHYSAVCVALVFQKLIIALDDEQFKAVSRLGEFFGMFGEFKTGVEATLAYTPTPLEKEEYSNLYRLKREHYLTSADSKRLAELEDKFPLQALLDLRKTVDAVRIVEARKEDRHGVLATVASWFGKSMPDKDETSEDEEVMLAQARDELELLVATGGKADTPNPTELRDYTKIEVKVIFSGGYFSLRSAETSLDIIRIVFSTFDLSLLLRAESSMTLKVSLESFWVEDCVTKDTLFPHLISCRPDPDAEHTEGGPKLLSVFFEKTNLLPGELNKPNMKVQMRSLGPLQVVYVKSCIDEVIAFFAQKPQPAHNVVAVQATPATARVQELIDSSSDFALKILQGQYEHQSIEVAVLLHAPTVFVPLDPRTNNAAMLVLDLGRIRIRSELAQKLVHSVDIDTLRAEEIYDRYTVQLDRTQMLIADQCGDKWDSFGKSLILHPTDLTIQFSNSQVPLHAKHPAFKLNLALPLLRLRTSDAQVHFFLSLVEHLKLKDLRREKEKSVAKQTAVNVHTVYPRAPEADDSTRSRGLTAGDSLMNDAQKAMGENGIISQEVSIAVDCIEIGLDHEDVLCEEEYESVALFQVVNVGLDLRNSKEGDVSAQFTLGGISLMDTRSTMQPAFKCLVGSNSLDDNEPQIKLEYQLLQLGANQQFLATVQNFRIIVVADTLVDLYRLFMTPVNEFNSVLARAQRYEEYEKSLLQLETPEPPPMSEAVQAAIQEAEALQTEPANWEEAKPMISFKTMRGRVTLKNLEVWVPQKYDDLDEFVLGARVFMHGWFISLDNNRRVEAFAALHDTEIILGLATHEKEGHFLLRDRHGHIAYTDADRVVGNDTQVTEGRRENLLNPCRCTLSFISEQVTRAAYAADLSSRNRTNNITHAPISITEALADAFPKREATVSLEPIEFVIGFREIAFFVALAEKMQTLQQTVQEVDNIKTDPYMEMFSAPVTELPVAESTHAKAAKANWKVAESITLTSSGIRLTLIDDKAEAPVPLIDINITEIKASLHKLPIRPETELPPLQELEESTKGSMNMNSYRAARVSIDLRADYFNPKVAGMEPLIEPWSAELRLRQSVPRDTTLIFMLAPPFNINFTVGVVSTISMVQNGLDKFKKPRHKTKDKVVHSVASFMSSQLLPLRIANQTGLILSYQVGYLTLPHGYHNTTNSNTMIDTNNNTNMHNVMNVDTENWIEQQSWKRVPLHKSEFNVEASHARDKTDLGTTVARPLPQSESDISVMSLKFDSNQGSITNDGSQPQQVDKTNAVLSNIRLRPVINIAVDVLGTFAHRMYDQKGNQLATCVTEIAVDGPYRKMSIRSSIVIENKATFPIQLAVGYQAYESDKIALDTSQILDIAAGDSLPIPLRWFVLPEPYIFFRPNPTNNIANNNTKVDYKWMPLHKNETLHSFATTYPRLADNQLNPALIGFAKNGINEPHATGSSTDVSELYLAVSARGFRVEPTGAPPVYVMTVEPSVIWENLLPESIRISCMDGHNKTELVLKSGERKDIYTINPNVPRHNSPQLQFELAERGARSDTMQLPLSWANKAQQQSVSIRFLPSHEQHNNNRKEEPIDAHLEIAPTSMDLLSSLLNLYLRKMSSREICYSGTASRHVAIYCPHWLINRTGNYIHCRKSKHEFQVIPPHSLTMLDTSSSRVAVRLAGEGGDPMSDWSNNFSLSTVGVTGVAVVKGLTKGSTQQFELGVNQSLAPMPFNRSNIITFTPRFIFVSNLDFDIQLKQRNSDLAMSLQSGDRLPFNFLSIDTNNNNNNATRALHIADTTGFQTWSGPFTIDEIGDFQVRYLAHIPAMKSQEGKIVRAPDATELGFKFVRVEVLSDDGATIFVRFSSPMVPEFRIENRSSYPITFGQLNVPRLRDEMLETRRSCAFTWDDHTLPTKKIRIAFQDDVGTENAYSLHKIKGLRPLKSQYRQVYVGVLAVGGCKTLIISDTELDFFKAQRAKERARREAVNDRNTSSPPQSSDDTHDKLSHEERGGTMVRCLLQGISLSLVDEDPRELIHFGIVNLMFTYHIKPQNGGHDMTLNIHHMQLDNCLREAPFATILSPWVNPHRTENKREEIEEELPFIQLRLSRVEQMNVLEDFQFLMQPIDVRIDENTIWVLVDVAQTMVSMLKKDAEAEMARNIDLLTHATDMNSAAYEHWLALPHPPPVNKRPTAKTYIELLQLDAIRINITLRTSPKNLSLSGRPRQFFGVLNVLKAVGSGFANISDSNMVFRALITEHLFGSPAQIAKSLSGNYIRQAIVQIYKVLGSSDLLGNPLGLVDKLGSGVMEFIKEPARGLLKGPDAFVGGMSKGVKALVTSVVSGSFDSVSRITGSMYAVVKAAGGDSIEPSNFQRPDNVVQGMYQGVTGAAKDIGEGIANVFVKPIHGAQQEGVKGFVKGMGMGLVGVVTNSVSAVLHVGTSVTAGITNTFNLTGDRTIRGRLRPPRPFGAQNVLTVYSRDAAWAQQIIADGGPQLRDDRVLGHVVIPSPDSVGTIPELLVVTDTHIVHIKKGEVVFWCTHNRLADIEIHKNNLLRLLLFIPEQTDDKHITTNEQMLFNTTRLSPSGRIPQSQYVLSCYAFGVAVTCFDVLIKHVENFRLRGVPTSERRQLLSAPIDMSLVADSPSRRATRV